MNFNLGLVGHPDVNLKIKKIVESHFDSIDLYVVDVINEKDFIQGIKKVRKISRTCNGILYTAKDIHYIFNNKLDHSIPNTYMENTRADIFKALFNGSYHLNADIKKISVDSLSYKEIIEAYSNLGIDAKNECNIKIIKSNYTDDGFVDEAILHHLNNYKYDQSLCITQITSVRDALVKKGIKAVVLENDKEQVIKKVNNLISKTSAIKNKNFDQVVISINISNLKENLIINNSQHSVVLEYNRIMEEVFWFAEKVEGAYSINGNKSYTIFCNRKSFEDETNHFSRLDILNSIAKNQIVYASIGVGYGKNFKEAIKHSVIANIRATNEKRNSAYVVYKLDKIAGPLLPSNEIIAYKNTVFDARLEQIASKSSININTIYKINSALKTSNSFTSSEVAQIIGVTRRSANRILEKLERSGFVQSISMKSNGGRGRPCRIIRFMF